MQADVGVFFFTMFRHSKEPKIDVNFATQKDSDKFLLILFQKINSAQDVGLKKVICRAFQSFFSQQGLTLGKNLVVYYFYAFLTVYNILPK